MKYDTKIKSMKSKNFYRLLSSVYQDAAKTTSLKDALTKLVDITTKVIGCERGTIFLNDENTGELYSFIAQGNLQHEIRVLNDMGLVGWSFTHDEPISIPDAYQDPRYNQQIDKITGFKTKSVLCVPLKSAHNERIGVTQMLNKISDTFNEHDIQLVQALTDQAALVIQSKLTIQKIEDAHKRELDFLEAISEVSTELKLSSLLDKIIETITKALGAERATLFINDEQTDELYTEASIGLEKKQIRFPNHLGIAGKAFTSGRIINIPYAYADLRFNPNIDKITGFFTRSILTAPVKNKLGKTIGVTQVLNKLHGQFNVNDESQLIAINTQISMAIENAKLFDDVQNMKNYNESMLESMSNTVLTINEKGQIVTCNRAGIKLLHFNKVSDLIGQDFKQVFNCVLLKDKIGKVMHAKDPSEQEILLNTEMKIGKNSIVANATMLPLINTKKEKIGVMIIIEDISSERRLKSTISRYMSSDLADKLLQSDTFSLGGTSTEVTVLFSDIRNFTSISEELGAEKTVKMLNEYFSVMVECIDDQGGLLDKFIGDAIMAVFGNPFAHEDDPDRAVRAALAMTKALGALNKKRKAKKFHPIRHGIGINTDFVVSGNIGSSKRMDFTVIGDGVNLASRIEGLCKQYGTQLLISEFTYRKLKAVYRTRLLDKVIVKGKDKPVSIYEIIDCYDAKTFPNQIEALNYFNNGIEFYTLAEWDKAIDCFKQVLHLHPQDQPSHIYIHRCRELKTSPPPGEWNGIWVMHEK